MTKELEWYKTLQRISSISGTSQESKVVDKLNMNINGDSSALSVMIKSKNSTSMDRNISSSSII